MPNELESLWYVAATPDMRITTNPALPITYYLVTYRAPGDAIETRFIYEHVGKSEILYGDWQRIAREHREANPL